MLLKYPASLFTQWEKSLNQVRTDWPKGSLGVVRIFCATGFANYDFDSIDNFLAMEKAVVEVVYRTEDPQLQALAFPDEVIFITQRLDKDFSYNFSTELLSIFSQQYFRYRESTVPFVDRSFYLQQDNLLKAYLSWRKQQWFNRHKTLQLKLSKESSFYIDFTVQ